MPSGAAISSAEMNWLEVSPGRRRLPPARPLRGQQRQRQAGGVVRLRARALRAQRLEQQAERPAPQLRRRVEAVAALAAAAAATRNRAAVPASAQ